MSFGSEEFPESYPTQDAPNRAKVFLPGVFLIIVAVVNLLLAGIIGYLGIGINGLAARDMEHVYGTVLEGMSPQQLESMKQMGITGPEELRTFYVRLLFGAAIVWGVAAVPALLGGIMMCTRRSRGLAVFGAIVAMLPLISPGCCLLYGLAVSIWALVVLFSPDGRAAFQ